MRNLHLPETDLRWFVTPGRESATGEQLLMVLLTHCRNRGSGRSQGVNCQDTIYSIISKAQNMQRTNWFDRNFPPIADNGLFPPILERLEGTPARLTDKIRRIERNLTLSINGKWSIQKEVGHLIDLEPLWHDRALQIIHNQSNLLAADLTNRKTHETDYDGMDIASLLAQFTSLRSNLMAVLRSVKDEDLENASIHPRLGTPMRLIDLAYFVAEHDDHHLAQMTLLSGNE